MKVIFLTEFFPPFATGGSEWSTYYLAKSLAEKGTSIKVITLNFGGKAYEKIEGFEVYRFPFYLQSKNYRSISAFWFLNPTWLIWAAWHIYREAARYNPEIIHVHGKYFIPPAILANLFLRKKIVATIRDYLVICNYGFCLYHKDKACTIYEYFAQDLTTYLKLYVKSKSIGSITFNLLSAVWGRFSTQILKFFTKYCEIVVLSKKQKKIFEANGFKRINYIYNSVTFPKKLNNNKRKNRIIYAGRLTPGKGALLFASILNSFLIKYPNYSVEFIGEGFLKSEMIDQFKNDKRISFTGQIDHKQLIKKMSQSKIVVMPSLWPEPFGRVALEALSTGTPVVITDRGGLPEIVDKRWGVIVKPDADKLLNGIIKAITGHSVYTKVIKDDFLKIKQKFEQDTPDQYNKIYEGILK